MPVDLNTFVEALRDSRLLGPEQFGAVLRDVRQRPQSAEALAKELVRRGWLTAYQAEQLVQGRGRDLALAGYVLLERLSEGGMGQVYKARHAKSGRVVALKVIRPDKLANPETLQRFHREARSLARLAHPNIVAVYEAAGAAGGTHFIAMEYIEGTDLARLVAKRGPLPVAEACQYIRQVALGLQHAHEQGLIHRDIKPSNLLLQNGPSGSAIPKLTDFGLARIDAMDGVPPPDEPQLTRLGAVMGTPDYMAPEQVTNSREADARSDLYSLGCTLYCLLAGHPPFAGGNLQQKLAWQMCADPPAIGQVRPGLPEGLAAVVHKLLAKKPEDRYQSAAELADALLPYCITTPAPQPRPVARKPAWPWLPVVGAGVVGVLLLMGIVAMLGGPRQPTPNLENLALSRLTNSLGMEFVEVPAGTFVMGSPASEALREPDEGPAHEVAITRPYYLGIHEVTQAHYQKVMGENLSDFREGKGGSPDHPVEHVTWDLAVAFCQKLAALEAERAAGRTYRLPTEAEWEYACRAGTTTAFAFGDSLSSTQANFDGKVPYGDGNPGPAEGKTKRVGSYSSNRFGLHDLHGNVWEWCADAYDPEFYRKSPREDPVCQAGDGRVARGGGWPVHGHECRSARRLRLPPTHDSYRVGFRVVCVVGK